MPRRPRDVRFRYVAFRVEPAAPRAALSDAIGAAVRGLGGGVAIELVLYRDGGGLVRCGHRQRDSVVAALNGIRQVGASSVSVRTIGTSGTIRTAREKYLSSKSRTSR